LVVKGVEEYSDLWAVRYTRLTARGDMQDAYFLFDTPDEAKHKRDELVDILQHHEGVYLSKKARKKLKTT
jgi:hypothetical protein